MRCQYPCTTYLFARVANAFFAKTQMQGYMPMPTGKGYVRWDSKEPEQVCKVHTENFLYVECEEYCWQRLRNYDDGVGDDGRKLRKENEALIRNRDLPENAGWREWMNQQAIVLF